MSHQKSSHQKSSHQKSNLPKKICVTCGLEFAWRKKWRKDWAAVKYCSERCRRQKQP
ncbi:MAG: DUF2256 domain-containing protein [Pseudomonadales bacterium]